MKITFNDSQYLEVQDIVKIENSIVINVINTCYETLKHLFTDIITTSKITLPDSTVYENYTVFSFIKEEYGGIFTVCLLQEGKDTNTLLNELTECSKSNEQQITDAQMALCDVYEIIAGLGV